ncbi:MAG: glycine cleavage system protein GcvH [bacterium]
MSANNTFYTKDHEWLKVEGQVATVGITDHAQQALGDITFVDLPKVGKAVKAHEVLLVVESVKAASDVFAPVSGTVSAVNDALATAPELINQAAQTDGWLCKLSPFIPAVSELMTAEQYAAFLQES